MTREWKINLSSKECPYYFYAVGDKNRRYERCEHKENKLLSGEYGDCHVKNCPIKEEEQ